MSLRSLLYLVREGLQTAARNPTLSITALISTAASLLVLAIVLFGDIWTDVGLGAAAIVVGGGLLLLAWFLDRKEKEKRAGIDELPRI